MMYRLIIIPLLFIAGCSLSEDELWVRVEAAKESSNWDSTLAVSQLILERYPDGRFAGWARFAAAESYRFKNQPREALDNYKIFIERYPDLQPAAVSLFLVGFIYNNNLQNQDSARFYYERFLEKYPAHELAPSVRLEVEMLGRTPQEALNERIAAQQRPLAKN
ncbi:MAG: tetratricopeptide repeat protein [Bacteroidetes bacterium]|nr:tetratricopeptide repeat protein [Bacteroidota bacterium]